MGLTVERAPLDVVAIADKGDEFEVVLAPRDEFEFANGTFGPGIYRVCASVGFPRIPGAIDSHPDRQRLPVLMNRSAPALLIIAGLFATAELVWSVRLGASPDPFSPGSALLVISGIVIYTTIAVVGMVLVRAPWARWLALAVAVSTLVIGATSGVSDAASIVAVALSLVAIGGLAGPWLRIWLRQRPGAGAGAAAVALPLVAVGALPLAGLASVDAATPAAFVLAVAGPILAWAYARGYRSGLWGLRIAVPFVALAAALSTGTRIGGVAFAGFGVVCAVLAWSPDARDALSPVQAPLPPPRAQHTPEAGR